jgi:hypothetical protein
LSHYKSILKDQSAVAHAEKVLADFKAVDYDVSKWNDAVSAFESKAVSIDCMRDGSCRTECFAPFGDMEMDEKGPSRENKETNS